MFNIFHPPQKRLKQEFNVPNIAKVQISHVRYLYLLLDEQLTRKAKENHLCSKPAKTVSAFKSIKRPVPFKFKRQLYSAFCTWSRSIWCSI